MQKSYATNSLFGAKQPQQERERGELGDRREKVNQSHQKPVDDRLRSRARWLGAKGGESSSGHAGLAGFVLNLPRTSSTWYFPSCCLRCALLHNRQLTAPSPPLRDRPEWDQQGIRRASSCDSASRSRETSQKRRLWASCCTEGERSSRSYSTSTLTRNGCMRLGSSVRSLDGQHGHTGTAKPEKRRAVASPRTARPRHRHCHRAVLVVVVVVASRPYWGGTTGARDQDRGSTCPIMPGDGDSLARFGKREQATECLNRAVVCGHFSQSSQPGQLMPALCLFGSWYLTDGVDLCFGFCCCVS
jgi:hypothetical protein